MHAATMYERGTVRAVRCPACGAQEGEHCRRRRGGERVSNHAARVTAAVAVLGCRDGQHEFESWREAPSGWRWRRCARCSDCEVETVAARVIIEG